MKVFISHSSKDKRFVRKLKDDLEENYISTWVDEDEMDIGDSLSEKLAEGIEDSTHFLIVLSPKSIESEWVRNELKNALKGSNKIIPIKYRDCKVPKEIDKLLYFDLSKEVVESKGDRIEFVTNGYSSGLSRLVMELQTQKYKLTNADKEKIQEEIEGPQAQKNARIINFILN